MYVKRFYFQLWRYLSYSLVHSGLFHVSFNILVQVLSFISVIIINVTINIFWFIIIIMFTIFNHHISWCLVSLSRWSMAV